MVTTRKNDHATNDRNNKEHNNNTDQNNDDHTSNDQNNEDQTIGYTFTDQTVGVASEEANDNGVLIEAGLDYTMARINSGSWKLFVRGGAEVWGGVRGTDWRASGGVTWQF